MGNKPHKLWERLSQKTVYKGRVQIVEHRVKLPTGELTTYEVDHSLKGAVAVFIKTSDNKIMLTYQFRFPLDRWIYGLPGGGVAKDESLEEAAIRECREELGIAPRKLEKLAMFYPNPARTDWPAHIYYCNDFIPSSLRVDDSSETIEQVTMPVNELKKLIDSQEIVDPALLIAWYAASDKGYIRVP